MPQSAQLNAATSDDLRENKLCVFGHARTFAALHLRVHCAKPLHTESVKSKRSIAQPALSSVSQKPQLAPRSWPNQMQFTALSGAVLVDKLAGLLNNAEGVQWTAQKANTPHYGLDQLDYLRARLDSEAASALLAGTQAAASRAAASGTTHLPPAYRKGT